MTSRGPRDNTATTGARVRRWARLAAQILLASIVLAGTLLACALAVISWRAQTWPYDTENAWLTGMSAMLTATPALLAALTATATRLLSWWWLAVPLAPFLVAWARLELL